MNNYSNGGDRFRKNDPKGQQSVNRSQGRNQPRRRIPAEELERRRRIMEMEQIRKSERNFNITVLVSSIIAGILIIVMLFSAMKFSGCIKEGAKKDSDSFESNKLPSINDSSIPSDNKSSALLGKTDDMGQSYVDSIIFVGDSNTAHMINYGVLSGGKGTEQVWVPESKTLTLDSEVTNKKIIYPKTKEQLTIAQAAERAKPKYMVITLGTNGINALNEDQFKYCYKKLINAVKESSKDTKIMVQSIFPVTSSYTKISNEKIDEANVWLSELASECKVKYLDTCSVLKDSSGALIERFNSDHKDGYHINKEAYEKILEYIRTHGYID